MDVGLLFRATKKINLGIISAILFSFLPSHIRWSATAETNIISIFFISLAVFFSFLYYDKKRLSMLWSSMMMISFAAQFRIENYMMFPLFVFGTWVHNRDFLRLIDMKSILPFALALLLSFPNFMQVLDFQASTDWIENGTNNRLTGDNWSFQNLLGNSLKYGSSMFWITRLPFIIPIFFFI